MLLDVWFSHVKGAYYVTDDRFDSVADAETFWGVTPFLISVERRGVLPPRLLHEGPSRPDPTLESHPVPEHFRPSEEAPKALKEKELPLLCHGWREDQARAFRTAYFS